MADKFKTLDNAYDKLKSDCAALHARMGDAIKTISKTNATLKNTMDGLRERIQELKNDGAKGTSIRDYVGDRDVRMMYAVAHGYSQSAEKNRGRADGKAEVKEILSRYKDLKGQIAKEADAAEKAKKKEDVKRYEDLSKKVAALETDKLGIKRLVSFDPDDGGVSAADLDARLKKMIAEIKPDASKAKGKEVKGYDAKSIKNLIGEYEDCQQQVWRQSVLAEEALEAEDEDRLPAIQTKLKKNYDELEEISEHFKKGLNDKKVVDSILAMVNGEKNLKLMKAYVKDTRELKTTTEKAMKLKIK